MTWIDRIPLLGLILLALWMAVAPVTPEPHIHEKLRMLGQGSLSKPIDMFDLLMHGTPLMVLAIRLWRQFGRR